MNKNIPLRSTFPSPTIYIRCGATGGGGGGGGEEVRAISPKNMVGKNERGGEKKEQRRKREGKRKRTIVWLTQFCHGATKIVFLTILNHF